MIQFHLDENMDHAIARGLRERGIDVTTSTELELIAASDTHQLEVAHRFGRVFVTHDDDHLVLHAQGVEHSGIAFCHPLRRSTGQIIFALELVYEVLTEAEMVGQVQFL